MSYHVYPVSRCITCRTALRLILPVYWIFMTVSFLLLMACSSVLCRYLILLDKFLEDRSPQEIEALTMPTLDELRETFDEQGAQWIQQALAANTG